MQPADTSIRAARSRINAAGAVMLRITAKRLCALTGKDCVVKFYFSRAVCPLCETPAILFEHDQTLPTDPGNV